VKPWLARTLLWSAIALVLLAGLWLLLDSKWSGEVGRLRARSSASVERLLPPIDPAQDAGPIYAEVGRVWGSWYMGGEHPLATDSHPSYLDSPEFAHIEELMHAAAEKPHCRLFQREQRSFEPNIFHGLGVLSSSFLLPAVRHGDEQDAWRRLDSLLALSAHLREDPLILSLLLSRALASRSLDELRASIAQIPLAAEEARRLLASVQRLHPESDVVRALDGERVLFAEPAWDSIVEGKFPSGLWMRADLADSLRLKVLRPWRLLDEAKYFELLEATRARLAANPWEELPTPELPDVFPITRIMNSGFPQLSGARVLEERHARDLAEIALRLALARAESGSYPATLDALGELPREPLTNTPYAYARAGEGYTLASWTVRR
jgi:hypothetical protein